MGSDLYSVSLNSCLNLDTQQAIERCLTRGFRCEQLNKFFQPMSQEWGHDWLELELSTHTIHPDACAGYDPCFVLRIIDEGVVEANYWRRKESEREIDWESTPLVLHYGGRDHMWGMDFKMTESKPSVVFIAEVRYHPGPPASRWDGGNYGDGSDVVALIPRSFAPDIEQVSSWDSRAWQGRDSGRFDLYEDTRRPCASELRLLSPQAVAWSHSWPARVKRVEPGPEDRLWVLSGGSLFQVNAQAEVQGLDLGEPPIIDFCWRDGVFTLAHAGSLRAVKNGAELWSCELTETAFSLILGPGSSVIAATPEGLLAIDSKAQPRSLLKRKLRSQSTKMCVSGTDLYLLTSQSLLQLNASSGQVLRELTKDQGFKPYGMDSMLGPLADGSMVFPESQHRLHELAKDGFRLRRSKTLEKLAPRGLLAGASSADGRLWLLTKDCHLLTLKAGQRPALFVWSESFPESKAVQSLTVTAAGDVLLIFNKTLALWPASSWQQALETEAANRELCPPESLDRFQFSEPAYADIDWTKKRVAVTGGLVSMTHQQAREAIEKLGATMHWAPTWDTDLMIVGVEPGANLYRSVQLGIPQLPLEALLWAISNADSGRSDS